MILNIDRYYLDKIIANIPQYIFWKDINFIYLGCNKNFARLAGLSEPSDVIGKTDDKLPWSKYANNIYRDEDKRIITHGESVIDREVPILTSEGEEKVILINKVPLYEEDKITGVLGIFNDITRQKVLEKSLREEKHKAEAANEAKSEFIRNMSHDLRTPFNGLINFSEYLLKLEDNPEKKEFLEHIYNSSKSLALMINEIIQTTTIETGQEPTHFTEVNLAEVMKSIKELTFHQIKTKALTLDINYSSEVPTSIFTDRMRLHRILLNLISNAIKFTDKGFVKVDFSMDNTNLIFSVTDTGPGIPKEKSEIIFDKFSRLTPSDQGTYEGLGLGLNIVKNYLEQLHGKISLESTLTKGSKFTCTVPVSLKISI